MATKRWLHLTVVFFLIHNQLTNRFNNNAGQFTYNARHNLSILRKSCSIIMLDTFHQYQVRLWTIQLHCWTQSNNIENEPFKNKTGHIPIILSKRHSITTLHTVYINIEYEPFNNAAWHNSRKLSIRAAQLQCRTKNESTIQIHNREWAVGQ